MSRDIANDSKITEIDKTKSSITFDKPYQLFNRKEKMASTICSDVSNKLNNDTDLMSSCSMDDSYELRKNTITDGENLILPDTQISATQVIYPPLVLCPDSVQIILPHLSFTGLSKSLEKALTTRNILTVGQFSSLTELDIHYLPIPSPKLLRCLKILTKYNN
ncbi:unnamed protein product [Gordionus sp. m RMFG-2023]